MSEPASTLTARFLELLRRWARTHALVSSGDLGALDRHVADSRALLPHLPADLDSLVDVGAGAGFPGVILAIERPALRVVLLEPNQKKWAFLKTVKRELGLDNLVVLAERDEEHVARPEFLPHGAAVSRATFGLAEWLERAGRLVRPGGLVLGMEARETIDLPEGSKRCSYQLEDRTRSIIVRRVPP
jgi:16S rRNA (guanine527-N7)-methyltransferase